MPPTLQEYCAKHNFELIEEYTTMGDVRTHRRAKVRNKETGEINYLYYDISKRYKDPSYLKAYAQAFREGTMLPHVKERGWRNTTRERQTASDTRELRQELEYSPKPILEIVE